jgi:hypothetical protein
MNFKLSGGDVGTKHINEKQGHSLHLKQAPALDGL